MVRLLVFSYKQVWGQLNNYLFIDWLIYSVLFVYFHKPTRRAWHSSLRIPRSSPLGTFREEKHRFSSRNVPQRRWARRNDCFRRVLTQKYYYEITWLFFRIIISFFFINLHSVTHSFDQNTFIGTTQMHPFAQSLFLANVRMVPSVPAITAFCLTSGNISIAMTMNGRIWMRKTTRGLKKCIVTWLLRNV